MPDQTHLPEQRADVLVLGDDWQGRFDHLREFCEVVHLSRTPSVSATAVIEKIRE